MKTPLKSISIICICFVIQAFQLTAFSQMTEGRIAKWEDNKRAAISLTFDDWCPGHQTKVVPELNARGMVGTFYIITGSAAPTLNLLKEAAAKGHEMGNHTVTHYYPTTPAEYESEIGAAKKWLDKNVGRVYTYGYAFGNTNPGMIAYTKDFGHIAGRTVDRPDAKSNSYNFATTEEDYYKLKTASIEDYFVNNGCPGSPDNSCLYIDMTPEKWQQYANSIEAVISGGGYLSFCYHGINPPDSPSGYWATISVDLFKEYLDKLEEYREDIWIATMASVIKYHRQVKFGNASLTEITPPDGNKWVVNLTHTLDDQETYNYPLTIMLKMNGVDYNRVTQDGGYNLPFTKLGNDTIMIKAVPNGGYITLEVSDFHVEAEISPKSIVVSSGEDDACGGGSGDKTTTLTGTVTVKVGEPNTLSTVTVDLSKVGGPSDFDELTSYDGVTFGFEYEITETLTAGKKEITFTATDDAGHTQIAKVALLVTKAIEDDPVEPREGDIVADFENGSLSTTIAGSTWSTDTDVWGGGKSKMTNSIMPCGANGTANSLKISYVHDLGTNTSEPYVLVQFNITPALYDFTCATGISFWHKGDAVAVRPVLSTVADYAHHSATVEKHTNWTLVVLNWEDFKQTWGTPRPFDLTKITYLRWMILGAITPGEFPGEVWIDEIQINKECTDDVNNIASTSGKTTVAATSETLSIYAASQISAVSLISVQGITISTQKVQDDTAKIPIASLPQGVYLAKIIYDDGKQPEVVKFIK